MDISNPFAPSKSGQYMAPVMTNDLAIKEHNAFIACWWDGFRVIDFQDPANPVLVAHKFGWFNGAVPGEEFCYVQALDWEGNYLYLIDYGPFGDQDTRGLYIFDISDPANPVKISRYTGLISKGYDIDVVDDFAYIADWNGGMEVIDITLKQSPVARGYISLPDAPWSIDVHENHAFLADYINGGVQVVNVTDPDNLNIDGYYTRSGCFALGVRVDGNNIYLSDGAAGFQIYKTDLITGIRKPGMELGSGSSSFPNPFTDRIEIRINRASTLNHELSVYDASGRLIVSLLPSLHDTGTYVYNWNGKISSGMEAVPGFYYFKTGSGQEMVSGKILKIK